MRYSTCPNDPHGPDEQVYAAILVEGLELAINPLTGAPYKAVGPKDLAPWNLQADDSF